jgi:hypothetical protein
VAKNKDKSNQIIVLDADRIQTAVTMTLEQKFPLFVAPSNLSIKNDPRGIYKRFVEKGNRLTIVTSTGTLSIRNKLLTQTHKDILEALMLEEKVPVVQGYATKTTINRILKRLKKSTHNTKWLLKKLEDIDSVRFTIEGIRNILGWGIFNTFKIDKKTGEVKVLWHNTYIDMYMNTQLVHYESYLEDIASLPHEWLKSIVRTLLMFKKKTYKIDDIFNITGYSEFVGSGTISNNKTKLRNIFSKVTCDPDKLDAKAIKQAETKLKIQKLLNKLNISVKLKRDGSAYDYIKIDRDSDKVSFYDGNNVLPMIEILGDDKSKGFLKEDFKNLIRTVADIKQINDTSLWEDADKEENLEAAKKVEMLIKSINAQMSLKDGDKGSLELDTNKLLNSNEYRISFITYITKEIERLS